MLRVKFQLGPEFEILPIILMLCEKYFQSFSVSLNFINKQNIPCFIVAPTETDVGFDVDTPNEGSVPQPFQSSAHSLFRN